MGTTSNFDFTQTLFLFNWVVNASAEHTGTTDELAELVYQALYNDQGGKQGGLLGKDGYGNDLYRGDWQLTWGPGVYQFEANEGGEADNTAFVVYSPSLDTYVLAIAGTNPKSAVDFIFEDANPEGLVDWGSFNPNGNQPTINAVDPTQAQISYGTAIGMWALMNTQSVLPGNNSSNNAGDSQQLNSLGAYLTGGSNIHGGSNIVVTGHSLGGALSTAMGLWLNTALKNNNNTIKVMPTAGPTPGNGLFQSNLFDLTFKPYDVSDGLNSGNKVDSLNCNVYCNQDLVPHAWARIHDHEILHENIPNCYFNYDENSDMLGSAMGDFTTTPQDSEGAKLNDLTTSLQDTGTAFDFTQSKNLIYFDTTFPVHFLDSNNNNMPDCLAGKLPDNADFSDYKNALIELHIWGYGSAVFGIDFSVFENLPVG